MGHPFEVKVGFVNVCLSMNPKRRGKPYCVSKQATTNNFMPAPLCA